MRNTMIKKLLLNQGKWETVEGVPPLTLEKSLGKNLKDYKIYGNSIQNGTPTPDTPIEVESVGEKTINKFENVQFVNSSAVNRENYKNGITATTKTDGGYSNYVAMNLLKDGEFEWGKTYTVSCFAEQTNSDMGSLMRVGYFRTTQNTWRSIKEITIKNNQTNTLTFTLPGEAPEDFGKNEYYSNNNIQMLFNVQVTKLGELGTLTVTDIMVVDGDIATPYEPYGKYKIPVVAQGKNLYDESNTDGWTIKSGEAYSHYDIFVGANKTVTVSWGGDLTTGQGGYLCVGYKNTHKGNGQSPYWLYHTSSIALCKKSVKVTADEEGYIYLNRAGGMVTDRLKNLQVEYGDTATDFEHYVEPIETNIYLDEPLRKAGTVADYIDFENGVVVRKIKERSFDGTEDWYLWKTQSDGSKSYALLGVTPVGNAGNRTIISNMFTYSRNSYKKNTIDAFGFAEQRGWVAVTVEGEFLPTLDDYKDFLSTQNSVGLPLKAYYEERIEELIDLPQLPTLKGTTVLDTKTNLALSNMSVVYKRR